MKFRFQIAEAVKVTIDGNREVIHDWIEFSIWLNEFKTKYFSAINKNKNNIKSWTEWNRTNKLHNWTTTWFKSMILLLFLMQIKAVTSHPLSAYRSVFIIIIYSFIVFFQNFSIKWTQNIYYYYFVIINFILQCERLSHLYLTSFEYKEYRRILLHS